MDSREESGRPSGDSYRRRSPAPYDRRQRSGRARSRSPPNIDRYQPDRAPRDDHYRQREDAPRRRGTPPPVQAGIDRYVPGHDPPPVTTNPLPNPMTLDYQVGFTWFAEWWRMDQLIKEEKERQKQGGRRPDRVKGEKESREERGKEREQIQAAYDSYKERLQVQMARAFVAQHKGEEWFKERYLPEARDPLNHQLSDIRREAYEKWVHDIDSGVFDEFTLEGIYKNESNGAGGVVEKEEGETTAANEVLGVGDLLPTRGGDLRDEAAFQPTLLVKTISPTVSRVKMEAFCKEHLGEGEGGFKWLSLSDPNPLKKYHRIGWVMLNPSSEKMDVDDRGDGRDGDVEDGEEGAVNSEPDLKMSAASKAMSELNGKTIKDEERGDFTCHVGIHEPPSAPRKKALWDLFSAPERIDRDLQLVIRLVNKMDLELGEGYDGVAKVEQQVDDLVGKGWLQPPVNAGSGKKMRDPDEMEEEEEGALDEDEGADEEVDDEELLAKKKRLDLLVEYLRRVHSFCLFCVFESDSIHELMRKCPGGHLRRPRSSLTTAAKTAASASATGQPFPFRKNDSAADSKSEMKDDGDSPMDEKKPPKLSPKLQQQLQRAFNWVKTYEDKLLQILDPDSVDMKKLGGKPLEEGMEEELSKYVKQEDEMKWRCKVPDCAKLFKGQNFWRKHVEKRHGEFFEKIKQDVVLVNTYVMDPAHIAPSRSDTNSNGHFPLNNNHGQGGTPRGFNLSNLQQFNLPAMPGGLPNAMQMAAFLAQSGINPSWNGNHPAFGGADDDRHASGPMRRTNNRFPNNRAAGPYDRPNKDNRTARWNQPGRLSPPRNGGGRAAGPPRFADGAAASVGPREAVQGRSLKSYEDLDAAGGDGTGALDY